MAETCEHDYRARFSIIHCVYHAVCEKCGHNAGVVDMRGLDMIEGIGYVDDGVLTIHPVRHERQP